MMILALTVALAQPACTPETATTTTVSAITAAPDQWLDRCVTVPGIASGIQLHQDRDSIYLSSRRGADGNSEPGARRGVIGIDGGELRSHAGLRARATRITVTGTVDSCERRSQRIVAAGGIPFLGGYCHYFAGPTIVVRHHAIGREQLDRLTGEGERARVGDLIEPPASWEWRDEMEEIGRRFAAAVHGSDRAALEAMIAGGTQHKRERVASILNPANASYRFLREAAPRRTALFVHAAGGSLPTSDAEHASAQICYARQEALDVAWPISSRDADAGADRPYLCIHVSGRMAAPSHIEVHVPDDGQWLAEPRAPERRGTR